MWTLDGGLRVPGVLLVGFSLGNMCWPKGTYSSHPISLSPPGMILRPPIRREVFRHQRLMQQRKFRVCRQDGAVDWGYHCGGYVGGSLAEGMELFTVGARLAGARGEGDALGGDPQRVDPLGV